MSFLLTVAKRISRGLDDSSLRDYEKRRKMTHLRKIGHHVFIWGDGSMGQLGMPTDQDDDPQIIHPRELILETPVVAIAAGGMHTLMLMEDGSLQTFGSNDDGALGRKTVGDVWGVDKAENDQMEQWKPTTVDIPDLPSDVEGVRCTDSGSFVWTEDGSVFGWGSFRSSSGLVGFSDNVWIQKLPVCVYKPASKKKSVTKLATGGHHVLALLKVADNHWPSPSVECVCTGWLRVELGRWRKGTARKGLPSRRGFISDVDPCCDQQYPRHPCKGCILWGIDIVFQDGFWEDSRVRH